MYVGIMIPTLNGDYDTELNLKPTKLTYKSTENA